MLRYPFVIPLYGVVGICLYACVRVCLYAVVKLPQVASLPLCGLKSEILGRTIYVMSEAEELYFGMCLKILTADFFR